MCSLSIFTWIYCSIPLLLIYVHLYLVGDHLNILGTLILGTVNCNNIAVHCSFTIAERRGSVVERRGSVVVSTSACHAAGRGSIPGPGALLG